MKVTRLFPSYPPKPFEYGRCQAYRECTYLSDKHYPKGTRHRCDKSARYAIDGVKLCTQHASAFALRLLLEKENVQPD